MGISKNPEGTPFSRSAPFIWIGGPQKAVLRFLGNKAPGSIKAVIAPPSFGKTTCLNLYADSNGHPMLRVKAAQDGQALASKLVSGAGLQVAEDQAASMLANWAADQIRQGRRLQVVVDDAQFLGPADWLCLKNIITRSATEAGAVEVVLLGQPKLIAGLADESVEGLDKLIHVIRPPAPAEVVDYINLQLRSSGITQKTFSDPAAKLIARVAGGRLPVVDNLCRLALVGWKPDGGQTIDIRRVEAALSAMKARKERREDAGPTEQRSDLSLRAEMILTRGEETIARFELGQELSIGRADDNDVVLDDPEIADRHATVVATPNGFKLVDLDSENGLRVVSNDSHTMLFDRDVIKLGSFDLRFLASSGPKRAGPLPARSRRGAPHLRRIK